MHSALAVANYLLKRAENSNTSLSGDQLQSLTYFAHGLRLALVNDALLDEVVMARRDGIFIESLASAVGIGTRTVTGLLTRVNNAKGGMLSEVTPTLESNDPACATLDMIWTRFSAFSGYELGLFVRSAESPWDETWNDPERLAAKMSAVSKQTWEDSDANERPLVIPNSLIRRWFRSLVIQEQKDHDDADGLEKTVHAVGLHLEKTVRISAEKKLRSA